MKRLIQWLLDCGHDTYTWECQETDEGRTIHVYLRCVPCRDILAHHIHEVP